MIDFRLPSTVFPPVLDSISAGLFTGRSCELLRFQASSAQVLNRFYVGDINRQSGEFFISFFMLLSEAD
jgi:hypothetical protein